MFGLRAAARKPDTQPSAPHHTDNLKTKQVGILFPHIIDDARSKPHQTQYDIVLSILVTMEKVFVNSADVGYVAILNLTN